MIALTALNGASAFLILLSHRIQLRIHHLAHNLGQHLRFPTPKPRFIIRREKRFISFTNNHIVEQGVVDKV
jgi:hypothetical protein